MRVYGNLMNRIEEHAVAALPAVGDGATIYHYTDRTAGTVTAVTVNKRSGAATITVTEDTATRTDNYGMSETQSYAYTPNPDGRVFTVRRVTLKAGKVWRVKGSGDGVRFGHRSAYHDYSF